MTRPLALLMLLCAAAALLARTTAGGAPEPWITDVTRPPLETCGGCHADVYAEWEPTLHHRSWTNKNILHFTNEFAIVECRPCHSPEPVLATGLMNDVPRDLWRPVSLRPGLAPEPYSLYREPEFRPENVDAGVHCLSCHGLADRAGVAALRDVPGAPCRPRRDDRLHSVALCASCHDPTHQAAQEHERSPAAAENTHCIDCHMDEVERPSGRTGRSHVFPGGFDHDQVAAACTASARLDGREVVVSLTARTGHKLPGEVPSRSLTVTVEAFDAAGGRVLDHATLIRRPFKNIEERDRADDRLLPGETREVRERLPSSAVRAGVRILFRSLPLQPERQAIQLGRFDLVVPP